MQARAKSTLWALSPMAIVGGIVAISWGMVRLFSTAYPCAATGTTAKTATHQRPRGEPPRGAQLRYAISYTSTPG